MARNAATGRTADDRRSAYGRVALAWNPWTTTGSLPSITLSALTMTATFESINIMAPFTESGGTVASAYAEVRINGTTGTGRKTLPLWPVRHTGTFTGMLGKALLCTHNTEYQVRVVFTDALGNTAYVVGTATTDNNARIPAASTLTPTHYIRSDGSDSNTGTADTAGGAWLTLDKARTSAPSGAVVQIGPGYFANLNKANATSGFNSPITLKAQYPAVDDSGNEINAGNWTVIEGSVTASPTGSGGPNPGPWVSQSVAGVGLAANFVGGVVPSPNNYQIWKWTGAGTTLVGYGLTRVTATTRPANWRPDTTATDTLAELVELMYTNQYYRYGCYALAGDLYVRMPGDTDPNNYWWNGSVNAYSLPFNAVDCRLSGVVFRNTYRGIVIGPSADNFVLDHCIVTQHRWGVYQEGTFGSNWPTHSTFQYNRFIDNHWSATDNWWNFVKSGMKRAADTSSATGPGQVGTYMEGSTISGTNMGTEGVFRWNKCIGVFDGIFVGDLNGNSDYRAAYGWDVYGNLFQEIQDDGLEPEYVTANFAAWNNDFIKTLTVFSMGPSRYGPLYIFRNRAWRTGAFGTNANGSLTVTGYFIKFSGNSGSTTAAKLYMAHNTFWSDVTGTGGGEDIASGGTENERMFMRNNILRSMDNVFSTNRSPTTTYDSNYNQWSSGTSNAAKGMKHLGGNTYTTIASHQARLVTLGVAVGKRDDQSNPAGDFSDEAAIDALLTDPVNNDLTLKAGTNVLVGYGVLVDNINDLTGDRDLGYLER